MRLTSILAAITAALAVAAPDIAQAAAPTAAQCADATTYSNNRRGRAVLVLYNGAVVCDTHSGAAQSYELFSGTKSFVGILAAVAVRDNLITLDDLVSATITEWQGDARKKRITIRQLISMTSGLDGTIDGTPPTYAQAIATRTIAEPGTTFKYSGEAMQVFGALIQREISADPLKYLELRVLTPLGITVVHSSSGIVTSSPNDKWRYGSDNNPVWPQGAILSARSWAKFGEFIRANGVNNGQTLVDPVAFNALFQGTPFNPGYGLTWWLPIDNAPANDIVTRSTDIGQHEAQLPNDLREAAGSGDQRLYVIRTQGLTIIRQTGYSTGNLLLPWSDYEFLRRLGVTP